MCTKRLCQWLLLSIMLLASHSVFAQAASEAARLMFVFGEVRVERDSAELSGQRNMPLLEGDSITTAPGATAQIRFADQSLIALRPDSTLRITSFSYDAADPAAGSQKTELLRGGLRAITGAIGSAQPQAVEFTTPVATMGIRGTELRIVHVIRGNEAQFNNSPAGTYLQVLRGAVAMRTNVGEQLVAPGQSFYVPDLDSLPQPLPNSPDDVFGEDTIQGSDDDEQNPPPSGGSGPNNPPPSLLNQQPLTPPEQAQQDQGQQQAEDIIDDLNPDPDPALPAFGLNSTALGYLQRDEDITQVLGASGELRQLTGSWYSFSANEGASPAFAQTLTAADWHLGAQSTISHGYWAADSYTLTPVTAFTGAGTSFHYLLSDYTLSSFNSAQQLGLDLYSNQVLQFALQPNYGVVFSDGSQLQFAPSGLLSVDFSSNAVAVDLQFSYLTELVRTLQGITSITELYANGMSLSEVGSNPLVQQGTLFGSFTGAPQWGIDAFLAGIYLRIAHNGGQLDGWGTLVFGNDCRWNFPCRVIDSDYRFMQQLGWSDGISLGSSGELGLQAGALGSWLATNNGDVSGALLGQRVDSSAGSYRFLALDSAGLVGADGDHQLLLETASGPLHIYWGYWQGGSYDLQILQGSAHDYSTESLDNSRNYHFIFANQQAPESLPEQVSFSYQLAGGSGLIGDISGTTIDPLTGNIVVDFTASEVAVMLLFEVGGEQSRLTGLAAITDLLGQSASAMELLGEGFFTSGSLYGQFVGGDFDALIGLLRAMSATEEFRGSVVFTRDAALGESLDELGFASAGMLGSTNNFNLFSSASDTRVLNLLDDNDDFVPTQQIGSQGTFDLISAITVDDEAYWTSDWGFTDKAGNNVAVRFGGFAPGSYRISDSNQVELPNNLPYFFAISNLVTPESATLPTGAMSFDLVAHTGLKGSASGSVFDWFGHLLVNFDAGDVAVALSTYSWEPGSIPEQPLDGSIGKLYGSASLQSLFRGDAIALQGDGYWQGGGGSLSGRFIGSEFDAVMALITAYTAQREQLFQGAGAFRDDLALLNLQQYGGVWSDDQLLGGNGILSWLVNSDGVYTTAPDANNTFAMPIQVRNGAIIATIGDYYDAYQGSRIWLDDAQAQMPSDISVQWHWWNPGSYYLQHDDGSSSSLVTNDRPLLQLLASDVTALGTTPLEQQMFFDLQYSDRLNRSDENVSLYMNGGGLLVDFAANSVDVAFGFEQYNYNAPTESYGTSFGSLFGSASVANLYNGDAIALAGDGFFEPGGGTFWGRFIGNNHQGVMGMLRAWFDAEANDELFGMVIFNAQVTDTLSQLDWGGLGSSNGGVISGNREMLLFSNPDDLLVVRDQYGFDSYYDYARLIRIKGDDFNVQGTAGYSGYFDRFTLSGGDGNVELRWGYWGRGNYRFTPANTGYSNDSSYWFVGANELTAVGTTPMADSLSFALYGSNIIADNPQANSYLYTNGGNLEVSFSTNTVGLNIDFSRYNYSAGSDEMGSLSGSGNVADLFEQNWLALTGSGIFANGSGEFAGRFIGDSYQGVMALLRAWDGSEHYSGALIFGAVPPITAAPPVEWGYWQAGDSAVSGHFAPPATPPTADANVLQQALLQQLAANQGQLAQQLQQLQQLPIYNPLQPGRIIEQQH
ncbi:FecR family protein [Pseudidiomarina mangrovi]|uniref:FecR family protein n=1 Tax=Pseudidiomarina mangrovi TaxID=2487133 RepID=UPI000FCAECF8|nr:FecR family protein [Pseudidiomarina mangrovi]